MNKFEDREKSFEKKFQIDQELQFKVQSRSNKYLAEYVCLKLGKNEDEKQNYINEIIKADMEEVGQEDVLRKIKRDFEKASIKFEDSEIRDQMEKALARAKEDFK
jgi:hypothetical protein|tara:strand:+ start:196 stop:510 length:315 start_codon:yes stop_codon:yes gene_type:complete